MQVAFTPSPGAMSQARFSMTFAALGLEFLPDVLAAPRRDLQVEPLERGDHGDQEELPALGLDQVDGDRSAWSAYCDPSVGTSIFMAFLGLLLDFGLRHGQADPSNM